MSKRELIATGTDERYVRRDDRFEAFVDVGKSLSAQAQGRQRR